MLSIWMHACSQSLSPLVDSHINNILLQTVPDISEALLQLINAVHTTFIHSLLRNTPDLIIHTGFRSGLFGGQRSEPMKYKYGITCCGSLMVSLA